MATHPLRVVTVIDEREVKPCAVESRFERTESCPYPGFMAEAVQFILKMLDQPAFEIVPRNLTDHDNVHLDIRREVHSGKYDLSTVCYVWTPERAAKYWLTHTIADSNWCVIASDRPKQQSQAWWRASMNFINVYASDTWLGIAAALLALTIYARIHKAAPNDCANASKQRFSLIFGVLMVFALNLYQNGILARLLMPISVHKFSTLAELTHLVRTKQIQVATWPTAGFLQDLKFETNPNDVRYQFAEALKMNPPVHTQDILDTDQLNEVIEGRLVIIATHFYCLKVQATRCGTRSFSFDPFYSANCGLVVSESTAGRFAFNETIGMLKSDLAALRRRYELRTTVRARFCPQDVTPVWEALQFVHVAGIVALHLVGCFLAALWLANEVLRPKQLNQ